MINCRVFCRTIDRKSNKLLSKLPNVDGLKTVYYRKAGYSVVATAKEDDLRLIVVVLGSTKARKRDKIAIDKFNKHFLQLSTSGG